jgi:hypothetical protein
VAISWWPAYNNSVIDKVLASGINIFYFIGEVSEVAAVRWQTIITVPVIG